MAKISDSYRDLPCTSLLGVEWPQCMCLWPWLMWHDLGRCDIARVGVEWPRWVCPSFNGCCMALGDVAWPRHCFNGCGMASVGVDVLSGCAWRQCVRDGLSLSGGLSVCIYHSSDVGWARDVLSECGTSLVCDMASVGVTPSVGVVWP